MWKAFNMSETIIRKVTASQYWNGTKDVIELSPFAPFWGHRLQVFNRSDNSTNYRYLVNSHYPILAHLIADQLAELHEGKLHYAYIGSDWHIHRYEATPQDFWEMVERVNKSKAER